MSRPVHFELPADNVDRGRTFYGDVFGWQFQKWDGPMEYWMAVTGPDNMPGVGWIAYAPDTEENPFGVMEEDVTAG